MRRRLIVQTPRGADTRAVGEVRLNEFGYETVLSELTRAERPREEASLIRIRLQVDDEDARDGCFVEPHLATASAVAVSRWTIGVPPLSA